MSTPTTKHRSMPDERSHLLELSKLVLAATALLVLALLARDADARSGRLSFFAKGEVVASTITIGDVARVQGVSPELAAKIRSIELGRSPSPTRSKTLSRPMVESALRRAGLDKAVRIKFPRRVVVTRPGRALPPDDVEQQLTETIRRFVAGNMPKGRQGQVQPVRWSRRLLVPTGELTFRTTVRPGTNLSGLVQFSVEALVDGTLFDTLHVVTAVEVTGEACSLASDVRAGEVLGRSNLTSTRRRLRDQDVACAEAMGMTVRSHLRAGSVLRRSSLRPPLLVKRGDRVTLVFERGALLVSAKGEAHQAGSEGEWIPVVNITSGKVVRGRVVGAGRVAVE